MKQRFLAARLLAVMLASLLGFSGCSAQTLEQREEKLTRTMSLVISSDAEDCVRQAAEEFINRVAYYSEGELQVTLSESEQIGNVLSASDTEFAFVENEKLTDSIEELKTLELPFYFKNADYHFSALNTQQTRGRLDELIGQLYPMRVQMAMMYGYEDLAADDTVDLTDYRKRYPLAVRESFFSDTLQEDIGAVEIVTDDPMGLLLQGKAEIAQADLSQVIEAVKDPSYPGKLAVLTGAQRIKTVYLLANEQLEETLTPKQKAAVEQASVMACGYCRTLADQQREKDLETLRGQGVQLYPVNTAKYFPMMGDIYQYQAQDMLFRPDPQLDRMIRSDGVKETF